jgi:hypothetical protein
MESDAGFSGKLRQDHLTDRVLARLSLVEHCLDTEAPSYRARFRNTLNSAY